MSLLTQVISIAPRLISTPFAASSEGSTNSGQHETAVAEFFAGEGWTIIPKIVIIPPTGRAKKAKEEYIMDRNTHRPKPLDLPHTDGYYTILQPYSKTGRGAMNPAPDLYIVRIKSCRITEWLGIECKSSKDSLCPMWNEHLPRAYEKGNIIYFFSGFDKVSKTTRNTLFTNQIFFRGREFDEEGFWTKIRAMMMDEWTRNYAADFPMVECKLRQFCGQTPFTAAQMKEMTVQTLAFLETH